MTMFRARQLLKKQLPGETVRHEGVEVEKLTPACWVVQGECHEDVFGAAQALVWFAQEKP